MQYGRGKEARKEYGCEDGVEFAVGEPERAEGRDGGANYEEELWG